jgi:hypothetical protein
MTNVKLMPVTVTGNRVYYQGKHLAKGSNVELPEQVVKANKGSFCEQVIEAEFVEVKPKKKKSNK